MIHNIQAHLNHPAVGQFQTDGLDMPQTTADRPHRMGNGLGHLKIAAVEIDIERHQKRPGTDHRGPGRRMHHGFTDIRMPLRVDDFGFQGFILAFPDKFQPLSIRLHRRRFIKIHGNAGFRMIPGAECMGQRDTFLHGDGHDRRKRYDIHGPDPRMTSPMRFHIDMTDGRPGRIDQGLLNRCGLSDQTDNQAVMIPIRPAVEKPASLPVPKAALNGIDDLRPSAFTEIGNTFNQLS